MKNFIKKLLREEIAASEARRDEDAIQTLIDNKRNICFISFVKQNTIDFCEKNGLKLVKVPENKYNTYIIYRPEGVKQAKELLNIANKYGGYLRWDATEEDSRRIGELLEYRKEDIDAYINRTGEYKPIVREDTTNQGLQTACNTMSVATYKEGMNLLINAIGTQQQNPSMWQKIAKPLNNWKQENSEINGEIKNNGMSGDSNIDESNTYWSMVQSAICQ